MKKEAQIIKTFKKKIALLRKHNNYYYNEDSPKISDTSYDDLKKNLLKLENDYPFLKKIDSVRKIVGAEPTNKFKKIKHF